MGSSHSVPLGMSRLRPDQHDRDPGNRTCVTSDILIREEPDDEEEEDDDGNGKREEEEDDDDDDSGGYSVSEALLLPPCD